MSYNNACCFKYMLSSFRCDESENFSEKVVSVLFEWNLSTIYKVFSCFSCFLCFSLEKIAILQDLFWIFFVRESFWYFVSLFSKCIFVTLRVRGLEWTESLAVYRYINFGITYLFPRSFLSTYKIYHKSSLFFADSTWLLVLIC